MWQSLFSGGQRLRMGRQPLRASWSDRLFPVLVAISLHFSLPAYAQSVSFDFDSATPALTMGQTVPFDQTMGGVTAHFRDSTGDFSVQNSDSTSLTLSLFTGNYLLPNSVGDVLVVEFSQPLTNISLDFATAEQTAFDNPTPIRLVAYTNSTSTPPVGSTTLAGTYVGVDTFPSGTLTFSSAIPFNAVTLNIEPGGAAGFLVDNINIDVAGSTENMITTQAAPAEGGTTSGDGTYLSGAPVTVNASPNPGYAFVDWTENGNEVCTTPDFSFTADSYRNLVANFVQVFALTTSASPAAGGSTGGDGTYPFGSNVSITATPNPGYAFLNWTLNGVPFSTWASGFVTMNSNETVVANFSTACTITASSSSTAAGSTSGGGAYAVGQTVNVVAVPNTGYAFLSWTESGAVVSTTASYSFVGSADRKLVANFAPNGLSVTFDFDTSTPALAVNQTTPFDLTSGGLTAHFSSTNDPAFSVQSDASTEWVSSKFSNNYLAPNVATSVLEIQFSQPITNISLTFATLDFQDMLTPSTIELAAYATSTAAAALGTASAQGTYTPGDSMPMGALTFGSAAPFQVVRIALPYSPQGASAFVLDSITAQEVGGFWDTITTGVFPAGAGSTTGGGGYVDGDSVTVTALAKPGYAFSSWWEGVDLLSTQPSYSFTASSNRTLVAIFAQAWGIATSASLAGGGITSGHGTYIDGSGVTVVATPNPGYMFVNWTEGGAVVSTEATYDFTASGNRSLVAHFVRVSNISVSVSPTGGGLASGGGIFTDGTNVTVTASPYPGYAFAYWTDGPIFVSALASYRFTASGDRTLVATFVPAWTVMTISSPLSAGVTSGDGFYADGTLATVTASANPGYVFANWTDGGIVVSTLATNTFRVFERATLVANFVPTWTVLAIVAPLDGGSTSGGGTYINGTSVTVTASPNPGYAFLNWTEGGAVVSTEASFSFKANTDGVFVANFSLLSPTLQVSLTSSGMVQVSWPTNSFGFVLQENFGFDPTGWTDTTNAVDLVGDQNQVTQTPSGASHSFRLRIP